MASEAGLVGAVVGVERSSFDAAVPAAAVDAADRQKDGHHTGDIRTFLAAFVGEVAHTCDCVVHDFVTKQRMLENWIVGCDRLVVDTGAAFAQPPSCHPPLCVVVSLEFNAWGISLLYTQVIPAAEKCPDTGVS